LKRFRYQIEFGNEAPVLITATKKGYEFIQIVTTVCKLKKGLGVRPTQAVAQTKIPLSGH
jgi:hypothetical protein